MASFFKKITKALGSPLARGLAAGAGLVAAGGDFGGNVNIPFLGAVSGQTLAGAANLVTAGSDIANRGVRADNVAQLGLGGFNVLQNNMIPGTNVGNFGSVSQVFGSRPAATVAGAGAPAVAAAPAQPLQSEYAPSSSPMVGPDTGSAVRPVGAPMQLVPERYRPPGQFQGDALSPSAQEEVARAYVGLPMVGPDTGSAVRPVGAPMQLVPERYRPPGQFQGDALSPSAQEELDRAYVGLPPTQPAQPARPGLPSPAPQAAVPGGGAVATQVATAAPAAAAPAVAGAAGSFGRRLLDGLLSRPLETLGFGMSLPSLFAPSPTDEAIQFYNERVQTAEAQVSLSSPQAQQWMTNFTAQAEASLTEEYKKADSTLRIELARRGMEDSTVANNARAKLEAEFAKKKIEIPIQAQMNWIQAARGVAAAIADRSGAGAAIGGAIAQQGGGNIPAFGNAFGRATTRLAA